MLHWSDDEWNTPRDTGSTPTALGVEYVDIHVDPGQKAPLRFTFLWPEDQQWQGTDYAVEVEHPAPIPAESSVAEPSSGGA